MLFPLYGRRTGVRLALGLHPLEVTQVNLGEELQLFERYAAHTSYIGEIGLDLSAKGKISQVEQQRALEAMLATKGVAEKVLTLHSRGAAREVVAAVAKAGASRAVLHWYSGGLRDLDAAVEIGCFFSVNPSMTRSANGRRIVSKIPRERVLLETDGPYVRVSGRPAEPRDVWQVVDYLATDWSLTQSEAAAVLERNLSRLVAGL